VHRLLIVGAVGLAALALSSSAGAWSWPAEGDVLRPFALGLDAYAAGQHRGIDVAGPEGSSVRAPATGTVSFAGSLPTYGKGITIATPDGYAVTLVHLGSIGVAKGDAVIEGGPIGTMGWSGDPEHTVASVHLGVRVGEQAEAYLDPLDLLPPRHAPPAPASPPAPAPVQSAAPVPAPVGPMPTPVVSPPPEARPAPTSPSSQPPVPSRTAPSFGTPTTVASGSAPAGEATPDLSSAAPASTPALVGANGGDVSAAESEPAAPFRVVRGTSAVTSTRPSPASSASVAQAVASRVYEPVASVMPSRSIRPTADAATAAVSTVSAARSTARAAGPGRGGPVATGVAGSEAALAAPSGAASAAPLSATSPHADDAHRLVVAGPPTDRSSPIAARTGAGVYESGRAQAAGIPSDDASAIAATIPTEARWWGSGIIAALVLLALLGLGAAGTAARRIGLDGAVLRHHADLLRQLQTAHRARVHDHRGRHRGASSAAAGP